MDETRSCLKVYWSTYQGFLTYRIFKHNICNSPQFNSSISAIYPHCSTYIVYHLTASRGAGTPQCHLLWVFPYYLFLHIPKLSYLSSLTPSTQSFSILGFWKGASGSHVGILGTGRSIWEEEVKPWALRPYPLLQQEMICLVWKTRM